MPIVVLWDEADLAAEPDAAPPRWPARIARLGASPDRARAPRSTARACGPWACPPPACSRRPRRARSSCILTIHAEPTEGPGAADWGWALGRVRAQVVIGSHASGARRPGDRRAAGGDPYESEGVYVSMNGRAQRLRPGRRGARGRRARLGAADRPGPPPGRAARPTAPPRGRSPPPRPPGPPWPASTTTPSAHLGRAVDRRRRHARACGRNGPPTAAADAESAAACRWSPRGRSSATRTSHRSPTRWPPCARRGAGARTPPRRPASGWPAATRVRLRTAHGECALPLRTDDGPPRGRRVRGARVPGRGVGRLLPADGASVHVEIAPGASSARRDLPRDPDQGGRGRLRA